MEGRGRVHGLRGVLLGDHRQHARVLHRIPVRHDRVVERELRRNGGDPGVVRLVSENVNPLAGHERNHGDGRQADHKGFAATDARGDPEQPPLERDDQQQQRECHEKHPRGDPETAARCEHVLQPERIDVHPVDAVYDAVYHDVEQRHREQRPTHPHEEALPERGHEEQARHEKQEDEDVVADEDECRVQPGEAAPGDAFQMTREAYHEERRVQAQRYHDAGVGLAARRQPCP